MGIVDFLKVKRIRKTRTESVWLAQTVKTGKLWRVTGKPRDNALTVAKQIFKKIALVENIRENDGWVSAFAIGDM